LLLLALWHTRERTPGASWPRPPLTLRTRGDRAPDDRGPPRRWLVVAALLAGACALGHLWVGWCAFPFSSWNEARLAPAFALRFGLPIYPPLDSGPLSTWIYGPVGALINLPATLANSAVAAIEIAGVINLLTLTLPLAFVCLASEELRHRGWPERLLAVTAAVLAIPAPSLAFQVADHSAMAFGLLSCWCLTRDATPGAARCALAATLCLASIWSKQLSAFLPIGQLIFLWSGPQRPVAWRYAGWLAVLGGLTVLVNSLVFGFGNLWLNLVAIPGRLPSVNFAYKFREWLPWLSLYVMLPVALIAASRRVWPARTSATGRLWRCSLTVFATLLPIGLLAIFKIGGATNVVHSWYYVLGPGVVVGLAAAFDRPGAGWWSVAAVALLCALRVPELRSPPGWPQPTSLVQAGKLAAEGKGTLWFPYHPLITFFSDRTLYHDEDGIMTRSLAGFGLRQVDPNFLPPRLSAIVYDAVQTDPLALRLLPDYRQREVVGEWAFYRRAPAAPR
jgi:hypothetical protein